MQCISINFHGHRTYADVFLGIFHGESENCSVIAWHIQAFMEHINIIFLRGLYTMKDMISKLSVLYYRTDEGTHRPRDASNKRLASLAVSAAQILPHYFRDSNYFRLV